MGIYFQVHPEVDKMEGLFERVFSKGSNNGEHHE